MFVSFNYYASNICSSIKFKYLNSHIKSNTADLLAFSS